MKKLFPVFLLLVTACASQKEIANPQYSPLYEAVVKIEGEHGSGSGFIYSKNHIVTAKHVAEKQDFFKIITINNRTFEAVSYWQHKTKDIAVLYSKDIPKSITPLEVDIFRKNSKVEVFGYTDSFRIYEANCSVLTPSALLLDTPVLPGTSGGPVIDKKTDRVIGIAVEGNDKRTEALPIIYLRYDRFK